MKKVYLGVATLGAAIMLAGAGCPSTQEQTETPVSQPTANETATPSAANPTITPTAASSLLTLSAEALGGNQVKLSWTAPNDLTDANRFIIVEGSEVNPVHDGKHSWLRQYHANRAVIWSKRSVGSLHYRLCLTENNQNDTCTKYSNDVMIQVK